MFNKKKKEKKESNIGFCPQVPVAVRIYIERIKRTIL
jgi:hypothetical protein